MPVPLKTTWQDRAACGGAAEFTESALALLPGICCACAFHTHTHHRYSPMATRMSSSVARHDFVAFVSFVVKRESLNHKGHKEHQEEKHVLCALLTPLRGNGGAR